MKKLLVLVLSFVLLLSLCACGGGTASQETPQNSDTSTDASLDNTDEMADNEIPSLDELLTTAVELDGYTFFQEYESNKVKLSSQYEGKSCLVAGIIDGIENSAIFLPLSTNLFVNSRFFLNNSTFSSAISSSSSSKSLLYILALS